MIRYLANAFYLFLFTALISSPSFAREISVYTLEWAPHIGADMPEQGLNTALVRAAFDAAGHQTKVSIMPWPRALKDVLEGKGDVAMGAYYNKERAATHFMSDPIYYVNVGLVTRPGFKKVSYKSLSELIPYTIGVARGYANSEAFDAAKYLKKRPATSPVLNIRKLFRGRIDMAVMEFDLFRYEAEREGFCVNRAGFMQPPLERHSLHIMSSRKLSYGKEIIDDFNRGLKTIKENGTYDAILARFRN